MEAVLLWTLSVLVIASRIVLTTPSIMVFEKLYFNEVIVTPLFPSNETSIFQTLTQISAQKCIHECKRLRVCDFINFHVQEHQCHMINSASLLQVQIETRPGSAYGVKTDWNLDEVVLGCSECLDTERCEFETVPARCHVEACGPPSFVSDTVTYGNMFRTGDEALYQCNASNTIEKPYITKCQNDGSWSSLNITCTVEESCVSPYSETFQTTVLSDNSEFSYLITTRKMDYANAFTYCDDRCGRLAEVLTLAKFTFLKNFLSFNSAYNHLDYYVDGLYDSTTGKWMTYSGTEIQYSNTMWSSNPAYFSSDQPCVRMKRDTQYKLNSHQCSALYGVICESP